jgi:hypothetical protein
MSSLNRPNVSVGARFVRSRSVRLHHRLINCGVPHILVAPILPRRARFIADDARRGHSLRAISGPVIRSSRGRVDAMTAIDARSPAMMTM